MRIPLRDERGTVSLLELTIVTAVLGFVLAAVLGLINTTIRLSPIDQERPHAVRDAQVGLAGMTRELRQAYEFTTPAQNATGGVAVAKITLRGIDTNVTYDCTTGNRCVRTAEPVAGGTSSTRVVIERVANPTTVFNRTKANYVEAEIRAAATGERSDGSEHSLVFSDGFFLRNLDDG